MHRTRRRHRLFPSIAPLFESDRSAGSRLTDLGSFTPELNAAGAIGALAARFLGSKARPVRAIAFTKSDANNWALGWHQDRTICVKERHEVPGYGPWTSKQGLVHVAPPFDVLANMLTIRVHVDPVDETNAPLLVALGSHRFGLIPEDAIGAALGRCTLESCLAKAGDVWIYATPILHASNRAESGRRRRVLQVDYSAQELPEPLEWRGIG
ncbi:phytanoyl-CoA dioxygenase family protein [Tsuneonella sp. HG222]